MLLPLRGALLGLLGLTALEFQLLPATHHKGDHEAVNKPQVVAFR